MYEINKEVSIHMDETHLSGHLYIPSKAKGIIIFSHGSGSSRFSKRNLQVARTLHEGKYGTLLFDLLQQKKLIPANPKFSRLFEKIDTVIY
jgi:hypothetical protein